jgi:hypothetical protein
MSLLQQAAEILLAGNVSGAFFAGEAGQGFVFHFKPFQAHDANECLALFPYLALTQLHAPTIRIRLAERHVPSSVIGRWTVEMLLIFNLGRPDVLPVHDLGVRNGFQFAYRKRKLPEPEQLARYGLRWSPHRTAAAWYLWRAADFLDGEG